MGEQVPGNPIFAFAGDCSLVPACPCFVPGSDFAAFFDTTSFNECLFNETDGFQLQVARLEAPPFPAIFAKIGSENACGYGSSDGSQYSFDVTSISSDEANVCLGMIIGAYELSEEVCYEVGFPLPVTPGGD